MIACSACSTVNRGTGNGGGTPRVGDHNLLLAGAHVAHDCQVGSRVILSNNVLLAGHVVVEDLAIMNGAAAIHHFGTIGTMAYIGGLSRLVHDAPPYMVVEGHPARVKKVNSVGLERNGVSHERIDLLQRAFRYLFSRKRKGIPLSERFQLLDAEGMTSPEVDNLRSFLLAQASGRHGRALDRVR
jgi:UDP-N-acetylglucosamine acyltransferase